MIMVSSAASARGG